MGCRISAMRNARSGPLRGETIDDAGHDLLSLPRTQFRQGRIHGRLSPDLRMRGGQKAPGLVAILPARNYSQLVVRERQRNILEVMDPRAANPDVFLQAYLSIAAGGKRGGGWGWIWVQKSFCTNKANFV